MIIDSFLDNKLLYFYFLIMMIDMLLYRYFYKQYRILKAGVEGEKETLRQLKKLQHHMHILSHITLQYKGQQCEIDQLIIDSSQIYIVETKNYKGYLKGNIQDEKWTQIKNNTTKIVNNPVKQVQRQAYILNQILKQYKIDIPIKTCVYAMNCRYEGDAYSVYTSEQSLLNTIKKNNTYQINKLQVKNIIKIIHKNSI